MSDDDNQQYFAKGSALIRANFSLDPAEMTPEEWADRFSEAVWLERFRLRNLAAMLAGTFNRDEE